MRFNGKDVRDVHGRISVNSEILPGAAAREIDYVEGRTGAVAAGVKYRPDEYRARINIASFNRNEAREIRALLAGWAASSGEKTAKLEPTHWKGKAYDAILKSVSAPEFVRGFATVDVIWSVPYPFARDLTVSRASGSGRAVAMIGGTHTCRPTIRQTVETTADMLTIEMDGMRVLGVKNVNAGDVIEMDVEHESLTINGVHAEEKINFSRTDWHAKFNPGRHEILSSDGGLLEVSWRNEWE